MLPGDWKNLKPWPVLKRSPLLVHGLDDGMHKLNQKHRPNCHEAKTEEEGPTQGLTWHNETSENRMNVVLCRIILYFVLRCLHPSTMIAFFLISLTHLCVCVCVCLLDNISRHRQVYRYMRVVLNSFSWKRTSSPNKKFPFAKLSPGPCLTLAAHQASIEQDLRQMSHRNFSVVEYFGPCSPSLASSDTSTPKLQYSPPAKKS